MQQPHAVIASSNDLELDARAQRHGLALLAAGYRVSLVGPGTGLPQRGEIVGIPYIRCEPAVPDPPTKQLSFVHRAVRKVFHLATGRRPPRQVLKVVARIDGATGAAREAARLLREKMLPGPAGRQRRIKSGEWASIPTFVATMKPVLMELRPDLLVTDVELLPLAVEVADTLQGQGHRTGVVCDTAAGLEGLVSEDPGLGAGSPALAAGCIGSADATLAGSEASARILREKHDLPQEPALVPNAPIGRLPSVTRQLTIRDFVHLPGRAALLVHMDVLSDRSGVRDVVAALPELPDVHLAVGARRGGSRLLELEQQAVRLGVRDRLHVVPFAPTHEMVAYLASATAAIFPFVPGGDHDRIAPSSYYAAVQARLPILISGTGWLSARVRSQGIGEVFEGSDPASISVAVGRLLGGLDRYRTRFTDELVAAHMFEAFVPTLQQVCLGVTSPRARQGLRPGAFHDQLRAIRSEMLQQRVRLSDLEIFEPRPRIRIGCANTGGQPLLWASALMREHPEVIAESVWLFRDGPLRFPVDETVTYEQWVSPAWQDALSRKLENRVTHVLTESARAMVGARFGRFFHEEVDYFQRVGIRQGLVFHGSDIRNPRLHAQREPDSPFVDPTDQLTAILQKQVDDIMPHVLEFGGPVFVTTNDLLDYLPAATWLPIVVDLDHWSSEMVPMSGGGVPKVFHTPSRGSMKGSDDVDRICEQLQSQGRIRYLRGAELTREQMHARMLSADIVIDQVRLGDYGITAVEAMSAGRVVVGHVADRVRARIDGEVPIVEATSETLGPVLENLLVDPVGAAERSRAGRAYAARWHGGAYSAGILADFMGL